MKLYVSIDMEGITGLVDQATSFYKKQTMSAVGAL